MQRLHRHFTAPGSLVCQQQWLRPLHVRALGIRRSRLRAFRSPNEPTSTPDLVDVQQNPAGSTSNQNGWSGANPTSSPPAETPLIRYHQSSGNGLNPAYVVAGAVAAITVAVAVVWLSGADLGPGALSRGTTTSNVNSSIVNAASGVSRALAGPTAAVAAGIAPALSAALHSIWTCALLPLADIPRHMFLGWQHMWIVMTSHPTVSALHTNIPQGLISSAGTVALAAVLAAGAALLRMRANADREKEAVRWGAGRCVR